MKTLIITAVAIAAVAGFGGRIEARDCGHGGGGHSHGHSYCGGGGHYHGCSSFGVSFGAPLYYNYPAYYSSYYPSYYSTPYYASRAYYSYPTYRTYSYAPSYRSSVSVDVQVALARRGYYDGAIDGAIGPMSRSAIRHYQMDRGLPVTSVIDYPLMRSLGIR